MVLSSLWRTRLGGAILPENYAFKFPWFSRVVKSVVLWWLTYINSPRIEWRSVIREVRMIMFFGVRGGYMVIVRRDFGVWVRICVACVWRAISESCKWPHLHRRRQSTSTLGHFCSALRTSRTHLCASLAHGQHSPDIKRQARGLRAELLQQATTGLYYLLP